MTTSENEEILLTSDDKSITLTNQRVIYKTQEVNQEILLKDVMGHEIIRVKEKYFLWLGIGMVALIIFIFRNSVLSQNDSPSYSALTLIILTLIFFYCYFSVTKKILKITGRYNSIEFSVKSFSENSLNTFRNKLSIESENRKKEKK